MTAYSLRSILALCTPVILLLSGTASGETVLQDNFNDAFDWKSMSDTSLEPLAAQTIDPDTTASTHANYVLRFMREPDARVFREITPRPVGDVITIQFDILKTGATNSGGLWLVDASGKGVGFLVELNSQLNINRLKVLSTTDAGATVELIDALPNVAPKSAPGQKIWHKVSIVWDTRKSSVKATIDGQPAGESYAALMSGPTARVILHGGYPSTLYLDDLSITATR